VTKIAAFAGLPRGEIDAGREAASGKVRIDLMRVSTPSPPNRGWHLMAVAPEGVPTGADVL